MNIPLSQTPQLLNNSISVPLASLLAMFQSVGQPSYQVAGDVIDRSKDFGQLQKTNRYQNAGGFLPTSQSAPILQFPVQPIQSQPQK